MDPEHTSVFSLLFVLDLILVFCIFTMTGGTLTPEVNESHYWIKAAHFWNPLFCEGDMFVESKDAHWFFFATVGALSKLFVLPVAVWIGRVCAWLSLAAGWTYLARHLSSISLPGIVALPIWYAAMEWGHLSGEWVVGGCEAKVFAYAFSFYAIAEWLQRHPFRCWVGVGCASAFHVLTGAWLALAILFVALGSLTVRRWAPSYAKFLNVEYRQCPLWHTTFGIVIGGAISLLGIIPGLLLNRGTSIAEQERGAMIYVFQRLPHHLVPTQFASERWYSYLLLVALTVGIVAMVFRRCRTSYARTVSSVDDRKNHEQLRLESIWAICGLTIAATLFASIGCLIDVGLSSWATNWSASLLRYYWFRWNDVLWPLLLAAGLLQLLAPEMRLPDWGRCCVWLLLTAPGAGLICVQYAANYQSQISPADRATLVLRTESSTQRKQVVEDWKSICDYIRYNTDKKALFLTPRFQQTFKWNAHRAEVACWKDAPQDALGLIEWENRLLKIFPAGEDGYGQPWGDVQLGGLRNDYGVEYCLIDKRIQKTPPVLEFVQSNKTFALFRYPK